LGGHTVPQAINNLPLVTDGDDGGDDNPEPKPDSPPEAPKPEQVLTCKRVAVAAGGATLGYIVYRVVRMLPSLLPPFWETIPVNLVVP
jgi:hypothetical protein